MPAKKAPSAIDNPNAYVAPAANSAIKMVLSTNNSSVRVCAISLNIRGNSHLPIASKNTTAATPFISAIKTANEILCSLLAANNGITINSGTTAKS